MASTRPEKKGGMPLAPEGLPSHHPHLYPACPATNWDRLEGRAHLTWSLDHHPLP